METVDCLHKRGCATVRVRKVFLPGLGIVPTKRLTIFKGEKIPVIIVEKVLDINIGMTGWLSGSSNGFADQGLRKITQILWDEVFLIFREAKQSKDGIILPNSSELVKHIVSKLTFNAARARESVV